MSSKDNTANADTPNINIPTWFDLHRLHTHVFANHLEFGNNDIIVWEAVQLEPCRDVDVRDVGVGCIILA